MDWFQIMEGVHQSCILSPCLFNFYAGYITQNARLDETQAGIKIAGRNINNLRYAVTLEPPKIKSVTVSIVFPCICHEVMGPDAMIFVF